MQLAQETRSRDDGFAMAALLVAMAVMAIVMSALLPVWRTLSIREREAELLWRGQQYDRAIQLYRKKNAAPGAPNVDALIQGRFLRRKYKDPITDDDFVLVGVSAAAPSAPGVKQPPIGFGQLIGSVRSKSKAHSFRELDGATTYNEWQFSYVPWKPSGQQTTLPGADGGIGGNGRGRGTGPGNPSGGFGSGSSGGRGRPPGQARPPGEGSGRGIGGGPGRGPGSGIAVPQEP